MTSLEAAPSPMEQEAQTLAQMHKDHPALSEEQLQKKKRERRKNTGPRRKMYRIPGETEQIVSFKGVSQNQLKPFIIAIEDQMNKPEMELEHVEVKMIGPGLTRLYPDKKEKKELGKAYRKSYYERYPEEKEPSEETKQKRKEYNQRPEVKKRKLENNKIKRLFTKKTIEENEDKFIKFKEELKRKRSGAQDIPEQSSFDESDSSDSESSQ